MIDSINMFCKVKAPTLYEALAELSFRWLIDLLYSGERTQAVGSLLFLSNMMLVNRNINLFNKYIIETFNGIFTLLNKISFKFTLSIQKRAHDLCKSILTNFKESLSQEEKMPAFKRLTDFLVRLLPLNKQYEQRILVSLLNQLFTDNLSQQQLAEILCGEHKRPDDKINIGDILNHDYNSGESVTGEKYSENCPPLYVMLDYVTSLLKSYRSIIYSKKASHGSARALNYEDCSTLTSVVLVVNYIFKLKMNIELFEKKEGMYRFDPYVQEILETLLDVIIENEHFNEKIMGGRGSSIRREERQNINGGPPREMENEINDPRAVRHNNQNFRPNVDVYYQNFEYHIYIDDYDFQVQGWSILIESIVLFLSSFMVKQEVLTVIRLCRNLAQAQQQAGGAPVNPPAAEQEAEYPVLVMRYTIIAKMFDLFSRLEHRIQEAVDKGFKQLLKVEPNEREIIPREQLEGCFKPLLAFMQNQDPQERRNNLNENSMHCFMKLYQLFKSCFNPERLFEKFTEYLSGFETMLQRDSAPPREEEMAQMNAIFSEIAIIASRLL
jgi:hypothetical protein